MVDRGVFDVLYKDPTLQPHQEAPSSKDPTLDIVDIRSELPDIAFPGHNLPPVPNKSLTLSDQVLLLNIVEVSV